MNYAGQQRVSSPSERLLHALLLSILGHPIPPNICAGSSMAKSRQPSKPHRRAHSLLDQYGKRSQSERIAAIKIEDPYDTSASALRPP